MKKFAPYKHFLNFPAPIVLGLISIYIAGCGPTIPIKFPMYPDKTGAQLKQVLRGKRNLGIIATKPPGWMMNRFHYQDDWSATVEAAVSTAITERGFFTVVDLENRQDRLRELAHSQSGLTSATLKLGKELQIDNMMVVRMTNQPRAQCRTVMKADYSGYALAAAMARADSSAEKPQLKKATAVMFLTVFVEGKLISTETGQTVRYSTSKPYEYFNSAGDTNCPSELVAFDPALKGAANVLADNLSPRVVTLSVPLMDEVGDARGDSDRISKFLDDGNTWAETNNFDDAASSWKRALSESGGTSMSAMWNLAVFNWYKGNYSEADKYFNKVKRELGPGVMSSGMMGLLQKFNEQKKDNRGRRGR